VEFTVTGVTQRMRWIVAGAFVMGSPEGELWAYDDEGPQHQVTLTRGFWLGDTPVTQALWKVVMQDNPSRFQGDDTRPVEQVSWENCDRFCKALSGLVPGLNFRLPTEAEWERACRAETSDATYGGKLEDETHASVLDPIAWYVDNSDGQTHPVKQKQPNAWGLYDMLGNVDEWCQDDMRAYGRDALEDPMGSIRTGESRVYRGGSWSGAAWNVRAASRSIWGRSFRNAALGFRLARDQAAKPG
jgi:formylglycine-generating enzyme required for sulfatase activity